ncbi:oligosaccharide flippase family protein [Paenibacillus alvei]
MKSNLYKNTMLYSIGNLLTKVINFCMLPLYTFYLTTNEFGRFDLFNSIILVAVPIVSFQLSDAVFRHLIEETELKNKKRVVTTSFSGLTVNVIFFLAVIYIGLWGYGQQISKEILLISFFAIAQLYLNYFQYLIRGLRKNAQFAFSGAINSIVLAVINIVLLVVFNMGYIGLIISNIIALMVTIVYIILSSKVYVYFDFRKVDTGLYKELIKYSIPLIPNLLCWWVINLSDRLLITKYLGLDQNGIYAIAYRFSTLLYFVTSVFNQAWQESAILSFNNKERNSYYTQVFNKYLTFLFTTMIIVFPMILLAFNYLFSEDYQNAIPVIPLLLYAVVFSTFSSFYGTGFQSSKNTMGALLSSVLAAVINFLLNILLIPKIGLVGSGLSTLISFAVMWIMRIFQTKKYFSIKINIYKIIKLLVLNLVYLGFYYWLNSNPNMLITIVLLIISMVIFVLSNKLLIDGILVKVKRRGI